MNLPRSQKVYIAAMHTCRRRRQSDQNPGNCDSFSKLSAAFCLESLYFVPCRQVGTSAYCCSAVSRSSIARPPPFLGVSSLNLAALRSGHFFWLVFCVLSASRSRSWAFKPTSLLRSCSGHKIPSQKSRLLVDIKSTSLAAPGQPTKFRRKTPDGFAPAQRSKLQTNMRSIPWRRCVAAGSAQ
jgi:hypothetical protein